MTVNLNQTNYMFRIIQFQKIDFSTFFTTTYFGISSAHHHEVDLQLHRPKHVVINKIYEGWNFNSGNYLFTTDTK